MNLDNNIERLIGRVRACPDFGVLFGLAEGFHSVGLTLRETLGGRMVLCRVANGWPTVSEMVDDYIFVGYADQQRVAISRDIEECVVEFIKANASNNELEAAQQPSWAGHTGLYGGTVRIRDEDVKETLQGVAIDEARQDDESNVLESIKKWLEDSDAEL